MAILKTNLLFLIQLICFVVLAQLSLSVLEAQETEEQKSTAVRIQGKVTFGSRPVSDAIVYAFNEELISEVVSDEEGNFQLNLKFDEAVKLVVVAEGKKIQLRSLDPKQNMTVEIRLKEQTAALSGRIIDNQGIGVSGAKLRLLGMGANDSLVQILQTFSSKRFESTTDQNGMFQFDGIAASMLGSIRVTGDGIVTSILTAESFKEEIVLVAQPARIVRGKVVDRISKQPISSVIVSPSSGGLQAEVDSSGEFELKGIPAFQPLLLLANPAGEKPYLSNAKSVPAVQGFDPTEVEIALEPGVWARCTVKDFGADQPASAQVFYFPTPENENFQSFVESFQSRRSVPSSSTNALGEAKIVAVPGPGAVAIVASGFPADESVNKLTDEQRGMLLQVAGPNLTSVAWIEPKDLDDEVQLEFVVSKGRDIEVEMTGGEIKPTDSIVVHRAASKTTYAQRLQGSKFVAEQFHPGEVRQIMIHSTQNRLGAVFDVKAEVESPLKVALKPTGSLHGQLVNDKGDPQAGLLMKFEVETDDGYQEVAAQVFTDANGRFEKPSLIAELDYRVTAIRPSKNQMMMSSPAVDSRWYVAEKLVINSGEVVDLGDIVLGAATQPEPKRTAAVAIAGDESEGMDSAKDSALPHVISGVVTDEAGEAVPNATIAFTTWPNRSGDLQKDMKLVPTVLAQSRSDANGSFQMTIDEGLEEKLVVSSTDGKKRNAAIVITAEKLGAVQVTLREISDPQNVDIKMIREMVIRGKVSTPEGSGISAVQLTLGPQIRVYDVDSLKQIIAELQDGVSMETISKKFKPITTLDPLAGGPPLVWGTSSSGAFLVRNIPLNAVFEIHAMRGSAQKTITVISRPIRGFDFTPKEGSTETKPLQGSRVNLDLSEQSDGN